MLITGHPCPIRVVIIIDKTLFVISSRLVIVGLEIDHHPQVHLDLLAMGSITVVKDISEEISKLPRSRNGMTIDVRETSRPTNKLQNVVNGIPTTVEE